ncbi:MAG TPA: hypothetical protein PKD46_11630 [Aggregatilineaceae bacterium]|nr:hypothetical protein [Aggregatilineaceae bacterium]
MAYALTREQVQQVVQNTVLVMLARSDLLPDWRANLGDLIQQMRAAALDDEAIFLAAVLALLDRPTDTLPTGTQYDQAWQAIVTGLQTGSLPSAREETVTLDRLLGSVVQAISAVQSHAPDQRQAVYDELLHIKTAALEAEVPELVVWIDDALDVLDGAAPTERAHHHAGVYGVYWQTLIDNSPSS